MEGVVFAKAGGAGFMFEVVEEGSWVQKSDGGYTKGHGLILGFVGCLPWRGTWPLSAIR